MIDFTDDQRRAIKTIDRSVIVTAAAGSGKTAVLAERCAHLVCDLPPDRCCGVNELLVVTFTEAAAAEMKSRILEAIRQRLRDRPGDHHLAAQAALIDTAQLSTLHAFCLWMLRRWFSEAGVDPMAAILDEDEARLLRSETLEALLAELYAADTDSSRGFVRLVDEYFLGNDGPLVDLVLRLADFLRSLPDPEAWLTRAAQVVGPGADQTVAALEDELRAEIQRQQTHVTEVAQFIERHLSSGAFYGQKLRDYAEQLRLWSQPGNEAKVREEIAGFGITTRGAPRLSKNAGQSARNERDAARDLLDDVRKRLVDRLRRLARFTPEEMRQGLTAVAPHVDVLIGLVREFERRYTRAKRSADVLDFSDLERGAFNLLHDEDDPGAASAIARELQGRFAHVLVDEFQDINPLQEAILRLVSRESDTDRRANLFCVGDVKQSIYRFRLAEAEIFQRRVEVTDRGDDAGACVRLQDNFRSHPHLLEGVNLLFERLMSRRTGGVDYDESARLRRGNPKLIGTPAHPIELHLLQRRIESARGEDDQDEVQAVADPDDPAQWKVIEREAYLIGTRIQALRREGVTVDDRPLEWRDVAVLLRAAAHSAGRIVEFLARMGIPAYTPAGGQLLENTEIRDVLALLQVLDNPQQDIPLASVLRSGVTGLSFDEDDLVAMRCTDREVPFHETVRRYAASGGDAELRERLSLLLSRVTRWRHEARRRPLADVLWSIYRDSGYLAHTGGLDRGPARRANLLALHERARQFGGFTRQGLHRFLRFIESLESADRNLAGAPPTGSTQNAVTVMTIHGAKGLEFPVVFVADLGHRFNLSDSSGRILFDRRWGIAPRVVEPERMIEYPSAIHTLAARSTESAARSEELRILYVALTRAEQRLILIGSADLQQVQRRRALHGQGSGPVSELTVQSAGTPLEWLIPALASAPAGSVVWADAPGQDDSGTALWRVQPHTEEAMVGWRLETSPTVAENHALSAAAALAPLPGDEPAGVEGFDPAEVLGAVDFPYPHLASASIRAVVAASEAKRAVDPFEDEHQARARPYYRPSFDPPRVLTGVPEVVELTPQQRGTLIHRVLEHLDFSLPVDAGIRRLIDAGAVTDEEADAIDADALTWFLESPLGQRIRQAGDAYRREFIFISTEAGAVFDAALTGASDDTVLVRGIADGVLPTDGGLEIVDYKTDQVDDAGAEARAAEYGLQLRLYARAVARIWHRPVARCWLVFLTPRRIIEVPVEQSVS
ncbi:MAG TPA: helicase-exonuclease AddAB subunit AddA [Phycisphaerae bacterium]|nr:helicase-exonuclease AddAB subunit AddA [Phycisphaerae bacterium]